MLVNIFFPIQTLVLCPIWGGGTEGDDCKLGKNVRKSRKIYVLQKKTIALKHTNQPPTMQNKVFANWSLELKMAGAFLQTIKFCPSLFLHVFKYLINIITKLRKRKPSTTLGNGLLLFSQKIILLCHPTPSHAYHPPSHSMKNTHISPKCQFSSPCVHWEAHVGYVHLLSIINIIELGVTNIIALN